MSAAAVDSQPLNAQWRYVPALREENAGKLYRWLQVS